MSWTSPKTFVAGAVLPASDLNTHLRDNENYLFGQLTPTEFNAGNTGAALTVNFSTNGAIQKVVLNANTTLTFTGPSWDGMFVLRVVHDGTATAYTVAYASDVRYPGGTPFAFTQVAGAQDVVVLRKVGTTWYASGQAAFA